MDVVFIEHPEEQAGSLVPYVVKQGDHLLGLAHRMAFDPDAIWGDPKNADLAKKRKDSNVLLPGDILYVPDPKKTWRPLTVGSDNSFTVDVPQTTIALRFADSGEPIANAAYEIEGVDLPPGSTDGGGNVVLAVPITTGRFVLRLLDRNEAHEIRVGHLDPPDEPSGAWARLVALGYLGRASACAPGSVDELSRALRVFQREHDGLKPTGELDEDTVAKLLDVHGS